MLAQMVVWVQMGRTGRVQGLEIVPPHRMSSCRIPGRRRAVMDVCFGRMHVSGRLCARFPTPSPRLTPQGPPKLCESGAFAPPASACPTLTLASTWQAATGLKRFSHTW